MSIHYLPQHLINKLKAGEIVERPSSIVKELIENSLDAGATALRIWIEEGGKVLIKIEDNGSGISRKDLPLAVARYATSKIRTDADLEAIDSYGFRGEALAAIAEVSTCRIQSRQSGEHTGTELIRLGDDRVMQDIPFGLDHGTIVSIQDLFASVPVRKKFLKSTTTERYHCRSLLLNYLLLHRDKDRTVWHDGKVVWQVAPHDGLVERVSILTSPDRHPHFRFIEDMRGEITLSGILGDASLHFPSPEQIRLFVNRRPVEDKIMKKALMQVVHRQLPAGLYPFAYLFLDLPLHMLDVNVHPRKTEVKFLDPGKTFSAVTGIVESVLGDQKVSYAAFTQHPVREASSRSRSGGSTTPFPVDQIKAQQQFSYHSGAETRLFDEIQSSQDAIQIAGESMQIIGQLWQTYILAESQTGLYLIDQHALAERIAFEQMKGRVAIAGFAPEVLLQPVVVPFSTQQEIERWIELFAQIGIDASLFGEGKLIIHAIPQVFVDWQIDMTLLCMHLWGQEAHIFGELTEYHGRPEQLFGVILEEITGMQACKASIKAGQPLSMLEMRQLVRDGQSVIPQMFVCQHGRPSVLKIAKTEIEKMVGRR